MEPGLRIAVQLLSLCEKVSLFSVLLCLDREQVVWEGAEELCVVMAPTRTTLAVSEAALQYVE